MKISIAVPSLNHGPYIGECLESIRTQTHECIEVLVADGGSSDDSLATITRAAAVDARFSLVSTNDSGQADAVQKAFAASTGDVFCFLNADDCYLRPDALELVARAFDLHGDMHVISFGGCYIDAAGSVLRPVRLRYHPLDSFHLMRQRTAVLQPATFWRREVQQQIPLRTELSYAFDAWFFFEASRQFRWLERNERIAGYRIHGHNKSVGVRADRIRELARLEGFKFEPGGLRERYLDAIAGLVDRIERAPIGARVLKRAVYLSANSLSFATAYRLPGI